jgi:hypothetical protein
MSNVYLFIDDLIFRSQVQVALQGSPTAFEFIASPEQISPHDSQLIDSSTLAVFDLSAGDVSHLKTFREKFPLAQTLAFLPHVLADVRTQAEALGCGRVVSRFEFSKNIRALLEIET